MQQPYLMQMQPMMAAYYPNNVTTDHIQQYLDENKSLILKIVESHSSGELREGAENQARLQQNLMYLVAIAYSQPQPPAMRSQYPSGAQYLQHQQAQQTISQSQIAARSPMLYGQQQFSALQQQQQPLHGQLGMSSGGGSSGLHMLQSEGNSGKSEGMLRAGGFPEGLLVAGRGMAAGGSKQEMGSAEGRRGSSGGGHGGETLYMKAVEDGN